MSRCLRLCVRNQEGKERADKCPSAKQLPTATTIQLHQTGEVSSIRVVTVSSDNDHAAPIRGRWGGVCRSCVCRRHRCCRRCSRRRCCCCWRQSLRSHRWTAVANFLYTNCRSPCLLMHFVVRQVQYNWSTCIMCIYELVINIVSVNRRFGPTGLNMQSKS